MSEGVEFQGGAREGGGEGIRMDTPGIVRWPQLNTCPRKFR